MCTINTRSMYLIYGNEWCLTNFHLILLNNLKNRFFLNILKFKLLCKKDNSLIIIFQLMFLVNYKNIHTLTIPVELFKVEL